MVKSYLIFFSFLVLFNCNENNRKNIDLKKNNSFSKINKDTINLSSKSKTIELLDVFFPLNIVSINDSIFINNNYAAPFYGSNKNKTSFGKYSTSLEVKGDKIRIELAKDYKTTRISLNQCNIINDELSQEIEKEFHYLSENSYLIDGGETQLWKLYCTTNNLIVLGFKKHLNIESIHPNCNYKGSEIPLFLRDIFITEKEGFKKGFSSLGYSFKFKNIIEDIQLNCE